MSKSALDSPELMATQGPPVLIYDDKQKEAESLQSELLSKGRTAEIFTVRNLLLARTRELKKAVFAIDIDHGSDRRLEGLHAIEEIHKIRKEGQDFLVVALTSHPEHELEAASCGANVFLRKATVTTDALELLTRSVAHERAVLDRAGEHLERELAGREYARLRALWLEYISPISGRPARPFFEEIQEGIARALRWPFSAQDERALLVALEQLFQDASESESVQERLGPLISEGLEMLERLHQLDPETLATWFRLLDEAGAETHIRWLDEHDGE